MKSKDVIEIPVKQQDGTFVTLRYPNTLTNRLFAKYMEKNDR
jgi:hypothetical protein